MFVCLSFCCVTNFFVFKLKTSLLALLFVVTYNQYNMLYNLGLYQSKTESG